MIPALRSVAEFLGALLLAPLLLLGSAICLALSDLAWVVFGRPKPPVRRVPDVRSASVVIPNWNGRDLLERYLPSVIGAMSGHPDNEIILVDNGSSDGSADFVRENFPGVSLLALPENLGFGGGSNAGFRAAKNDIVVLLNSDMRVEPGFLAPLLAAFRDGEVFAVSCQIFLSDPSRRREETGLTEGWWESGRLRVTHRDDPAIRETYPCFYAGGGSSAFDRAKFLDLGGFDPLLEPFYLEDTDLGFLAWKRGWKVLYEPRSVVFHEHRGTIGRTFTPAYIDSVLQKNYLLFAWKNLNGWRRLSGSFLSTWAGALASSSSGARPLRTSLRGVWNAFRQTPGACRSRFGARERSVINDAEVFARSRGSHFRDRFFEVAEPRDTLRVLFVSPYPILPAVHGGAVFMLQTVRELSKLAEVHAVVLLDEASQREANLELAEWCASVETMVRPRNHSFASLQPHAAEEFASREVRWLIDRMVFLRRIDVVQIEYTAMAQYIENYHRVATALFEHDVYFQSIIRTAQFFNTPRLRWKARFEYLRALRFELTLLPHCDQVQVCTRENREYLLQFKPELARRLHAGLRAAIDTGAYPFPGGPREPDTILFIGSSRHGPNQIAVEWFVEHVLPRMVTARPQVRFLVAGFDSSAHPNLASRPQVETLGYVEAVKPLLGTCALFVCPVLSGSGVRVKLLEAFASGIPVVSTRIGAEGLARIDGDLCALADEPGEFAQKALKLLGDPESARHMAARARVEVEVNWDSVKVTARLERSYREIIRNKNVGLTPPSSIS